MIQTKNYAVNTHVANVPCSSQKGLAKETLAGLKQILVLILSCSNIFYSSIANAQIIADTFAYNGYHNSGDHTPIYFDNLPMPNTFRSWVKLRPNELAQRGIVPGVVIYGINYHKYYNGYLLPSTQATFEVKLRSGSMDSTIPNNPNNSISITNFYNYYIFGGFSTTSIFNNGSTLILTPTIGWLQPLMFDNPFVYTGGTLEVATDFLISSNINIGIGITSMSSEYTPNIPSNTTNYALFSPDIIGPTGFSHNRPAMIFYHSAAPTGLCTGIPNGGVVSGDTYVCKNANFTLYLNSPSAGPGITYQWQKSGMSPVNWVNISGATNPVTTTSTADTTQYCCQVTCTNSNHTAYSTIFTAKPHYLHIDSVTTTIASNLVTLTGHYNDTTFVVSGTNFLSNWTVLGALPYFMGSPSNGSFGLTTDGTYIIHVVRDNYCGSDTVTKTITIGCAGSTTFYDSITVDHNSVCPGSGATLTILDTIPVNYTNTWVYYTASTSGYLTGIGNNLTVYPTVPTTYYNVGNCTLSNNFKTSNSIQITITPPPTAGTIQATNTTTNYYNFTNNGMSNAQTYKWFFGDGDSSTSLAPSHHYNLAGTYNVWFVVTNAGNGCTYTAFTTVNITTGVEETNPKLFTISPNPFNESFVVNCPSAKGTLTIVDATGKQMLKRWLSGVEATIDMKGYPAGVYLIKYQNDNQTSTQQIIKN